jgi:hypothetical protein
LNVPDRSQVNVNRSSNFGIDRIVIGDGGEGERFLLFPILRNAPVWLIGAPQEMAATTLLGRLLRFS